MVSEGHVITIENFVLAALSTSEGQPFRPVQVQKLFFLLDKNIAPDLGGEYFNFAPYDYGPFDAAVYRVLEKLAAQGLVIIESGQKPGDRTFRLSSTGQTEGSGFLSKLGAPYVEYIEKASEFVRQLSFGQLVSAIYKAYPEMKVNSVFAE